MTTDKPTAPDAAGMRGAWQCEKLADPNGCSWPDCDCKTPDAGTEGLVKEWPAIQMDYASGRVGVPALIAHGDKMAAAIENLELGNAEFRQAHDRAYEVLDDGSGQTLLTLIHQLKEHSESQARDLEAYKRLNLENSQAALRAVSLVGVVEEALAAQKARAEAAEAREQTAILKYKGKVAVDATDLEAFLEFFQDTVRLLPLFKIPPHVKARIAEYEHAIASLELKEKG